MEGYRGKTTDIQGPPTFGVHQENGVKQEAAKIKPTARVYENQRARPWGANAAVWNCCRRCYPNRSNAEEWCHYCHRRRSLSSDLSGRHCGVPKLKWYSRWVKKRKPKSATRQSGLLRSASKPSMFKQKDFWILVVYLRN